MWRYLIVSFAIILAASTAMAQDYVRVKYLPGYPTPGTSMEAVDIEIKRMPLGQDHPETDVDRYFDAVSKIISEDKIRTNWERFVIDAPSVHVEVSIAENKISLGASYSGKGIDSFSGPDERYRRASEGILKLTLKRLNEKSPVK